MEWWLWRPWLRRWPTLPYDDDPYIRRDDPYPQYKEFHDEPVYHDRSIHSQRSRHDDHDDYIDPRDIRDPPYTRYESDHDGDYSNRDRYSYDHDSDKNSDITCNSKDKLATNVWKLTVCFFSFSVPYVWLYVVFDMGILAPTLAKIAGNALSTVTLHVLHVFCIQYSFIQ